MTNEHNNPPAFPQTYQKCEEHMTGMTLLDHFAGLAMQGALAKRTTVFSAEYENIAKLSYEMADAMLKERQKWINK